MLACLLGFLISTFIPAVHSHGKLLARASKFQRLEVSKTAKTVDFPPMNRYILETREDRPIHRLKSNTKLYAKM